MKHTCAQLKEMARINLSGKWGIAVAFTLLYSLITGLLSTITVPFASNTSILGTITYLVVSLIISVLTSLFAAGFSFFCLNICRGKIFSIGDLFAPFRMHPDRFLTVFLILASITTVIQIPSFFFYGTASNHTSYLMVSSVCNLISSIAGLVLDLFFVLSVYLMLDFPDLEPIAAMKLSATLMKGNKGRYFYICLSFLGWMILSIMTCGIGALWQAPYMELTLVYFYADVLKQLDTPPTQASQI